MPGRIWHCKSTSAAGVSRRNSSVPTRAARRLRSFWGMDEIAKGVVGIKALRQESAQEECPLAQISERLGVLLGLKGG